MKPKNLEKRQLRAYLYDVLGVRHGISHLNTDELKKFIRNTPAASIEEARKYNDLKNSDD